MSTRRDRQSSRSKPALEFSRQGQSTLDDDVRGFLSLRSGSQRHAREQERQVEVVEDDEVQEVKRVKPDPFAGNYGFADDNLRRLPLRRTTGRSRKNVSEVFQDDDSADDEDDLGLSDLTAKEQEDVKRALRLSRREQQQEEKKQQLLYRQLTGAKATNTRASNRREVSVVIPSTEDKDFRGQVSKHEDQEQTPGREGAESPDLFSVDESEMEVEEFQSSPTVPCGPNTSHKQHSAAVSCSPTGSSTRPRSNSTTQGTVSEASAVEVGTAHQDSNPWLTAGKADKKKLKLNMKKPEVQTELQFPASVKVESSSSDGFPPRDSTRAGIKRKSAHVKTEPVDGPPGKRRSITIKKPWSAGSTNDEPVILVLDDDDDEENVSDAASNIGGRTRAKAGVSGWRQPRIWFERCYNKTPPLPRTAKEAYKAGLYFAPPGVSCQEYSPYVVKLFRNYARKLRQAQSKAPILIPWGDPVVCGPRESNSLDYKAPAERSRGSATSGLNLEGLTQDKSTISEPIKPLNYRQQNLRSHSRSKNSVSVTGGVIVDSDSEEELRSYLQEAPNTAAQNSWKGLLKRAEQAQENPSFDAKVLVPPSQRDENRASQEWLKAKVDADSTLGKVCLKKAINNIAPNKIDHSECTEEYEINTSQAQNATRTKENIATSSSSNNSPGRSSHNSEVCLVSGNSKQAKDLSTDKVYYTPESSPIGQPKPKQKHNRNRLDSSSDEDFESDLPKFSLQVPSAPDEKKETNPQPKTTCGRSIEIKIPPLDSGNIRILSSTSSSRSVKSQEQAAGATKHSGEMPDGQTTSTRPAHREGKDTRSSQELSPTTRKSEASRRDRSPRSEKSAKLAAAAELRMRQQNSQSQETGQVTAPRPSVVDLREYRQGDMDNHLHAAGKDTVAQPETEHECPLCFEMFGASAIHQHAAACQGLSAVEQPPPGSLLQAMRSSDIKPTTRSGSERRIPKSRRLGEMRDLKVVLERSPVADRKAYKRHVQASDAKRALHLNPSESNESSTVLKERTLSVSSDEGSATSGITVSSSARELRPRRGLHSYAECMETETEEGNCVGGESNADSPTHSWLSSSPEKKSLKTYSSKKQHQQVGGTAIQGNYDVGIFAQMGRSFESPGDYISLVEGDKSDLNVPTRNFEADSRATYTAPARDKPGDHGKKPGRSASSSTARKSAGGGNKYSRKRSAADEDNDRALDHLGRAWSSPCPKRSRADSNRASKSRRRESDSDSSGDDSDWEKCYMCSKLVPKVDYEEHVAREIAERERRGADYEETVSSGQARTPECAVAAASVHSSSESVDDIDNSPVKTFQRISEQSDSCIDFDNQFDCFRDSSRKSSSSNDSKSKVFGWRGRGKRYFRKSKQKKYRK